MTGVARTPPSPGALQRSGPPLSRTQPRCEMGRDLRRHKMTTLSPWGSRRRYLTAIAAPQGTGPIAGLTEERVSNGNTANGTKIHLWDCNGTGARRREARPRGALANPQSGCCPDLPGSEPASGVQRQICGCAGGANRTWRLPS